MLKRYPRYAWFIVAAALLAVWGPVLYLAADTFNCTATALWR